MSNQRLALTLVLAVIVALLSATISYEYRKWREKQEIKNKQINNQ